MSCFIVSSCFKLNETIDRSRLIALFHFAATKILKQPPKRPPKSSCFIVSVVSIYRAIAIETSEQLLKLIGRDRKIMIDGRQVYTSLVSCREIPDSGDWDMNYEL